MCFYLVPINQPCSSEMITPNPLNCQSTCEGDNETEQHVDGMLIIMFSVYIIIYIYTYLQWQHYIFITILLTKFRQNINPMSKEKIVASVYIATRPQNLSDGVILDN